MHIKFENGKFVEVEPPAGSEPTKAEIKAEKAAAADPIKDEDIPSNKRINTNLGEFVEGQVISVLPHQEAEAKRLIANTAEGTDPKPGKEPPKLSTDTTQAERDKTEKADKAEHDKADRDAKHNKR